LGNSNLHKFVDEDKERGGRRCVPIYIFLEVPLGLSNEEESDG
jgi:hypothetical protein